MAPLNYLARRAARSYITGPDTSTSAPAPVANPRAKVEKMDNLSYSKLTPAQKRERLKAKNFKPTDKKSYSKVFLENPERKDKSRTNPNRNMDNESYSRLFPEQKRALMDGINPYDWVRPTMNIPVAQKTFGPGA